jgi:hypothetical protein
MTLDDVLRIMSGVRTLEDCKRAWEVQAEWLREHPEDEVVIDEGEALYMHEEALKHIEAQKQAQPVA